MALLLMFLVVVVLLSGFYYIAAHMGGDVNLPLAAVFYGSLILLIYELVTLG